MKKIIILLTPNFWTLVCMIYQYLNKKKDTKCTFILKVALTFVPFRIIITDYMNFVNDALFSVTKHAYEWFSSLILSFSLTHALKGGN